VPSCSAAPHGGGLQRLDEGGVRAVDRVDLIDGAVRSQALLLDVGDEVRQGGHMLVRWLVVHEALMCFLSDLLQHVRGPRDLLASHEELADVGVLQPHRTPQRHAVSGYLAEICGHVLGHTQL
jgi:hypothetical protein